MTVVSEVSFSGAAQRLGVCRSAVSRSVQKLEARVGTRLLSRTTRCTTIAHEGERFYENCRLGVEGFLQALDETRDLRDDPPQGALKISALHSVLDALAWR